MKKLALVLSLLALGAFGVAACGDDDEGEDTTAAETTEETTTTVEGESVSLTANPDGDLAYEETSLSAAAGAVTIEFDNPASIGHDVVVEDSGGTEIARTDVISSSSATAAGEYEAGDYTYYCSVPGHREAGMEGTLTVE
jgi:plastocyanin